MRESLSLLEAAREEGVDVTADAYPYPFWGSRLDSARFAPGWQKRFQIGYGDLQLAGSAERLTPASFARYRRQGKLAVAYAIPEEDVVITAGWGAVLWTQVVVASLAVGGTIMISQNPSPMSETPTTRPQFLDGPTFHKLQAELVIRQSYAGENASTR